MQIYMCTKAMNSKHNVGPFRKTSGQNSRDFHCTKLNFRKNFSLTLNHIDHDMLYHTSATSQWFMQPTGNHTLCYTKYETFTLFLRRNYEIVNARHECRWFRTLNEVHCLIKWNIFTLDSQSARNARTGFHFDEVRGREIERPTTIKPHGKSYWGCAYRKIVFFLLKFFTQQFWLGWAKHIINSFCANVHCSCLIFEGSTGHLFIWCIDWSNCTLLLPLLRYLYILHIKKRNVFRYNFRNFVIFLHRFTFHPSENQNQQSTHSLEVLRQPSWTNPNVFETTKSKQINPSWIMNGSSTVNLFRDEIVWCNDNSIVFSPARIRLKIQKRAK